MTPPRTFSSSLAVLPLLFLAAVLTGCATHVGRCAGAAGTGTSVRVPLHAEGGDAALHGEIKDLLAVKIECDTASYDPVTEQGRWPYWIEFTNTAPKSGARTYEIHLTTLERAVGNGLEATFDGKPAGSLRPLVQLDVLRADLHIPPGRTIAFPCAETVVDVRGDNRRNRAGLLTVLRRYTGDVTIREGTKTEFVPVRIDFYVDFLAPGPEATGTASNASDRTARRAEWARVTDFCETCRPQIICESLGRPKSAPSDPSPDVHVQSDQLHLHFVAGLERRPVAMDTSLGDRTRTVACTRWTREDRTAPGVVEVTRQTDSTEYGIAGATPFLLVHHRVWSRDLSRGKWTVDLFLLDALDPWTADGRQALAGAGRTLADVAAMDACQRGTRARSTSFELR